MQDYYPATATLKARRMSGRAARQDLKQFFDSEFVGGRQVFTP